MKDILTLQEVAKYLRVNPKTIYRNIWGDKDKIKYFEIGNRFRFLKSDIDSWIYRHRK